MHGEWHGAELATGVSEQAIAISTATSATHGRNAATTAARSSALAVKRVQNPRLTLEQLRPRAGVASAVQEHPEVPGQGWGQLRRAGSSTEEQHGPSPGARGCWNPCTPAVHGGCKSPSPARSGVYLVFLHGVFANVCELSTARSA